MNTSLSVKCNNVELSDYLIVSDLRRGVGTTRTNKLQKMGLSTGSDYIGFSHDYKTYEMDFVLRYDLIEKRRKLAGILNVDEPVKVVFGDEPDKYVLAVPDGDINVDENNFLGKGTIVWLIPDGVSYSNVIKSSTASLDENGTLSVTVDNQGTDTAPLSFEATMADDNGFLGVVGPLGAMEFGNISEVDGYIDMSEWLFKYHVIPSDQTKFTKNSGVIDWKISNGGLANKQQGAFKFNGQTALADNFGTAQTTNLWYGPSLSVSITPKASDGKKDGNWRVRQWLVHRSKGNARKLGRQEITMSNVGAPVASVAVYDDVTASVKTRFQFRLFGQVVRTFDVDEKWLEFYGSIDIWKDGNTLYFKLYHEPSGSTKTFSFFDERLSETGIDKWTYWAAKYKNNTPVEMSLNYLDFMWVGSQGFVDTPNRYTENDVLKYDGESGKFYVNGTLSMNDIIQGSTDIKIPPGTWTVEFYYSEFSETPPNIVAKLQERWL